MVGVATKVVKVSDSIWGCNGGSPDVDAIASSTELRVIAGASERTFRLGSQSCRQRITTPALAPVLHPEKAVVAIATVVGALSRRHIVGSKEVVRQDAGISMIDEAAKVWYIESCRRCRGVESVRVDIKTVAGVAGARKGAVTIVCRLGGQRISTVTLSTVLKTKELVLGTEHCAALHCHRIVVVTGTRQGAVAIGVVDVAAFARERCISLMSRLMRNCLDGRNEVQNGGSGPEG